MASEDYMLRMISERLKTKKRDQKSEHEIRYPYPYIFH